MTARDLPCLISYKNVGKLFDAIFSAKPPDLFTHQFLQNTLGITAPLPRNLGFIDATNRPPRL